ncbi:E3 SUMO-protein ligase KIAA1586-like [Aphis craccivora]|uniref:E3 SUMO-protein ligase KIAA1586-like n=1 Tax=Aphis craccivora TaxID=307492 RepID=A0A6G0VQ41_APHCR|nr:E3 SUMO-protein ligase KIAA1586-like [Aphis craccivora]
MLIGYASDGVNVMMGAHNSLATTLKDDIPNIFILKCICHSFHLFASYACTKLPISIEETVKDIYNFLNTSPKRLCKYAEFQTFLNIKQHKMLQPSQTRWLSLLPVVNRLLEQFDAMKLYFTGVCILEKSQ